MSGTELSTMRRASPSAMAVLPTPASPTSRGLFLRRRHSVWITRSSSWSRPMRGSILPASACALRFCAKLSSGEAAGASALVSAGSSARGDGSLCGVLVMPWEMKLTISSRVTPCWVRKYTACESFSPNTATSTFAPVTSFLPEDCTCRMARWITRWKPSVGCVSTSRSAAMRGVCSVMCCVRFLRSSSMLAPQERSTSAAVGLSSSASSRCSTVMNSWRFWRASTKAMCRLTSSSWAIMSGLLHHALQRMLVLARVVRHLLDLGGGDVVRVHAAHAHACAMHFQHHLGRPLPVHAEEFLQHQHHELHRRVIVVEQQNLVHRRKLDLRLLRLDYRVVLVLH